MATSDEARQAIIDAIKASAEGIVRRTSDSGTELKALAEAWAIVHDDGGPQVF